MTLWVLPSNFSIFNKLAARKNSGSKESDENKNENQHPDDDGVKKQQFFKQTM